MSPFRAADHAAPLGLGFVRVSFLQRCRADGARGGCGVYGLRRQSDSGDGAFERTTFSEKEMPHAQAAKVAKEKLLGDLRGLGVRLIFPKAESPLSRCHRSSYATSSQHCADRSRRARITSGVSRCPLGRRPRFARELWPSEVCSAATRSRGCLFPSQEILRCRPARSRG